LRFSTQCLLIAVYQHERHVWYAAAPEAVKARLLPKGFKLQRSGLADLDRLSESNLCGWTAGEKFLAEGGDLWIVREGERIVFCCWIFRKRMPTVVARCGWKDLPSKMVCLEGPVTDMDYRGRGIAPAAWFLIAQSLMEEAIRTIIIKVKEHNMPMRRAVLRAGLHEVAVMDYLHVGGLSRVRVDPLSEIIGQDREVLMEMQKIAA
jgi:RimJ/RimL family protein N-acetyltransferase